MLTSTRTSPIVIPVSAVLHVLGRNYDESILLTSKYNQSLLHDRRLRQSSIVDSQTGISQMNSSQYHSTADRLSVTRTDQVCVYPRRIYRRHARHNPYLLTIPFEEKPVKIETNSNNDSSEQRSSEHFNEENASETIGNLNDDQVVIPNEYYQSNKFSKQRVMLSMNCSNCQQKFKNKHQLNIHLTQCRSESAQTDHNTRRQFSKSESLLVSLLKQEAVVEKKRTFHLNKTSSMTKVTNQKLDDDVIYDSSIVQQKFDRKDPDFMIKKSKTSKKTSTKTQSLQSHSQPFSLITCTMCGEANLINDELIRCSTCEKSIHAYRCLNFENNNIVKTIKTYSWQCIDCKKCIQCGTVEHDDELLFCDYCDRAYHMDCLNPPLNEPPPGAWYCQLCV